MRALSEAGGKAGGEAGFVAALRALATDPAARGLLDDAAVLAVEAGAIVLTHDAIVEGVHFLPSDPPGDVAWKLVAVNLSDLAAKGATPMGMLLGYPLAGDCAWDEGFLKGLGEAIDRLGVPLLGGDTVSVPPGTPRSLGLTAIGRAPASGAPARSGAQAGDALFVTGTIGDAGLGLRLLLDGSAEPVGPIAAYRRPVPLIAEGIALAPQVHAMMDVSDGLLLDAERMAAVSGLALEIDLEAIPLSASVQMSADDNDALRLAAATAGDDYQLLFAAPASTQLPVPAKRIGRFYAGGGLRITGRSGDVPLPATLGYLHR